MGGPSILVMTMIALWSKQGNSKNAIFAIVMSLVTWAIANYLTESKFPIIMTVVICGTSYYLSLAFFKTNSSEEVIVPETAVPGTSKID
jgi:hypothetical protein